MLLSTAFDADDTKTLWAAIKDSDIKNLILDGSYYAQLNPTNRDAFQAK